MAGSKSSGAHGFAFTGGQGLAKVYLMFFCPAQTLYCPRILWRAALILHVAGGDLATGDDCVNLRSGTYEGVTQPDDRYGPARGRPCHAVV